MERDPVCGMDVDPKSAAGFVAHDGMSWGRRLKVEPSDLGLLRTFIKTNSNRSPEPGIR